MSRVRHVRWRKEPLGSFELSSLGLNRREPLAMTRRGSSHIPLAAASPGRDDRWSRPPTPRASIPRPNGHYTDVGAFGFDMDATKDWHGWRRQGRIG